MELTLTDATFEEELKKASLPMLVDFWAAWCGPCKMIAPILDEIAAELEGKLIVGKLDVDANSQSAMKYQTLSIPTLILFKNGVEVKRMVGYQDKPTLMKQISDAIGS